MKQWLAAIRMLSAEVRQWHAVIGHSLGGFATAASTRADLPHYGLPVQADRLVLIAAPDRSETMMRMVAGYLRVPTSVIKRTEKLLSEWIDADFTGFSTAESVAAFPGEVLAIHASDDQRVPLAHLEAIRAAAPDKDFIIKEGLGHRRILEDESVHESIVEFLQESVWLPERARPIDRAVM